MTKSSPTVVTGAHISIIGHITECELQRYLGATEIANGFGNRFLWVCVGRSKLLPEGENFKSLNFDLLFSRFQEALGFGRQLGEIRRDSKASTLWNDVYPMLTAERLGSWGEMTARAEAQVMRLACLYAILDLSPEIREEHLTAALALWAYCDESVRYLFGDIIPDPFTNKIHGLLKGCTEGLTLTDIHNLLNRNATSAQVGYALDVLLGHGLAECKTIEGSSVKRWYAILEPEDDFEGLDSGSGEDSLNSLNSYPTHKGGGS
jgi:hypothetical protein